MSDTMLTKIASEALKPMSSVIDALLGPKLQRIRNWSEKQDLSSRLGSGKIDVQLDQYIRQLLRRICGVTTIVFPQRSLPLTSIYEPLVLRERATKRGSKETTPFSVGELEGGLNYFVVDSAGMGKSTFAKHLVLEVLNSTTKIPLFLELRRIGENESLLGKLAAEIDKTGKVIDERLLPLLLEESEFVLILDGYDEVAEQTRKVLGEQITQLALLCENLQIMITARPEVSLPDLPSSKVLTIDPLTKAQAESLVLRYDDVANIDVGKKLANQFNVVSEQFLTTPLLVVLLYRTYGFNQSIATKISSFYDEVFNALFKGHDLSKAGFAREKLSLLDSEDFRRLLRGFSFLLAVRQTDSLHSRTWGVAIVDEAIRLTSVRPSSASAFFDDLLLAVPLLVKEGTEYRFIHKSISEFFAAEFISYHPNSGQIIKRIRWGNLYESFINSFQYLSEINPSIFRRFLVAPIARDVLDRPLRNPLVQTVLYLSSVFIGLWPAEPFTRSDTSERFEPPQPEGFTAASWTLGQYKGRSYALVIAYNSGKLILPDAAWKAITELVSAAGYPSNHEYDFNYLENVLGDEVWVPIDDESVLDIADQPEITELLMRANHFAARRGGHHSTGKTYMVISVKACEDLLAQIQQEDETQSWLESLV